MSELTFDCPRCGNPSEQRYYGPCATCGEALTQRYRGTAKPVEAPEYEPKMNVTPNAVATKD